MRTSHEWTITVPYQASYFQAKLGYLTHQLFKYFHVWTYHTTLLAVLSRS